MKNNFPKGNSNFLDLQTHKILFLGHSKSPKLSKSDPESVRKVVRKSVRKVTPKIAENCLQKYLQIDPPEILVLDLLEVPLELNVPCDICQKKLYMYIFVILIKLNVIVKIRDHSQIT